MRIQTIRKRLVSAYIMFTIVISGFVGLLVFEGVVDDGDVEAATLTVGNVGSGAQYNVIQEAIDASSPNDTISLMPGTYYQHVWINHTLNLDGNGFNDTIIDGFNTNTVIRVQADNVRISNLTVRNGQQYLDYAGVLIDQVDNCIIENSRFLNNQLAIHLDAASGTTIYNNICETNQNGITLQYSSYNIIERNTCFSNGNAGIHLTWSNYNILFRNVLNNNNNGIYAGDSSYNIFNRNTYTSNDYIGIALVDSTRNNITNSLLSNGEYGIRLTERAKWNNIFDNEIKDNSVYGIEIRFFLHLCEFNSIFHNNMNSNSVQAVDNGDNNEWDDGNGGGNHWSDYSGLDNGANGRPQGDGIGDTNIPHLNLDGYPFVEDWGWMVPNAPNLNDPGEVDSDGEYTITWDSVDKATSYILEEDTSDTFTSPSVIYDGSQQNYEISGRGNGTYYYRVRAYNEYHESSNSNVVEIEVDWPPDIPKNLAAEVDPVGNTLNLSWDLNQVDTKKYEIHYYTNGPPALLDTINHLDNTYSHTGLTDGLTYYYQILAIDNRDQASELSDSCFGTPMDLMAPPPPPDLTIYELSYDSITLSWSAGFENDVVGYNVYRSMIPDPLDWGDPINGVDLISETKYVDKDLTELTTYYYAITAQDEVPNESDLSSIIFATTPLGPHAPEINNSLLDFEVEEDSYDDISINLYHWFKDINGDDLYFNCQGQEFIDVVIYLENGTVGLSPKRDWNGQEALTFHVSDGQYDVVGYVNITVTSVNDPPVDISITGPENNTVVENGTALTFEGFAHDADIVYGDALTYSWSSDQSGVFGTGSLLHDITLSPGKHNVTLSVVDKESASNEKAITVTINPSGDSIDPAQPGDSQDQPGSPTGGGNTSGAENEKEGDSTNLYVAIIIIVILLAIIGLFFYFKFTRELENEDESEPPLPQGNNWVSHDQLGAQSIGYSQYPTVPPVAQTPHSFGQQNVNPPGTVQPLDSQYGYPPAQYQGTQTYQTPTDNSQEYNPNNVQGPLYGTSSNQGYDPYKLNRMYIF